MKILKIRTKTIRRIPVELTLPRQFTSASGIKLGDKLDIYVSEFGDLIIKKQGGRKCFSVTKK
jgi:bifunctional DNA-binding transcriptional regulator/antitoxin component of YhaV-PrlF toxin-antitoxin module